MESDKQRINKEFQSIKHLIKEENYEEALNKLNVVGSDSCEVMKLYGICYFFQGLYPGAYTALLEAKEKNSSDKELLGYIGRCEDSIRLRIPDYFKDTATLRLPIQ